VRVGSSTRSPLRRRERQHDLVHARLERRDRERLPEEGYGSRRSAIDARTTRRPGYAVSQRFRKRIEEVFGWMKTAGNFRKTRFRGFGANQLAAYMVGAAYNLLRVARLLTAPA
jgi:hypothetical protein